MASQDSDTWPADAPNPKAGQRIGKYELICELGHGGMGAVYLAGRVDDPIRKQVAIKVMLAPDNRDAEHMVRRFLQEGQILAGLEHPNVARFLDGDITEDGRPYLVMEYVEGEPIDAYCDRNKLSIEERLELFLKVCSAVQAVHGVPVVHRDIKPGNILVGADGEPKLLDFGVAKLVNPGLAGLTVAPTGIDQFRLFTPEYASPEQIRGGPVTTASDVYSLGVLLYELLTGHRPYRFKSRLPQEVERVVCETEPERPGTVVLEPEETGTGETIPAETLSARRGARPEGLHRQLSGDLDNIVLMAMRKEPQRRYATVEQFAEDIRRHLRGLPVVARPATFRYLAGKFVRRNKLPVAFVALLALFAVGMTFLALRLAEERDLSERQRLRAENVSDFMVRVFEMANRSQNKGENVTALELLDSGLKEIESRLEDQPEVKAAQLHTMARAYFALAEYETAADLVEKALDLRRSAPAPAPLDIAETLVLKGLALKTLDNHNGAKTAFEEALRIRKEILDEDDLRVVESINRLALLLALDDGSANRAEELLRESLATIRRILPQESPELFNHLTDVGSGLMLLQLWNDAELILLQALGGHRRFPGQDHKVAETLNELTQLYDRQGKFIKSASYYQELMPIVRRVFGEDHGVYALALANQALAMQFTGDLQGAESNYRKSLTIFRQRLPEDNSYIARTKSSLAALLTERGKLDEARDLIDEALVSLSTVLKPEHWRIRYAEAISAVCLVDDGRFDEAETLLLESYRALSESRGPRSPYAQLTARYLVRLYEAWGKPEKAAKHRALLSDAEG